MSAPHKTAMVTGVCDRRRSRSEQTRRAGFRNAAYLKSRYSAANSERSAGKSGFSKIFSITLR